MSSIGSLIKWVPTRPLEPRKIVTSACFATGAPGLSLKIRKVTYVSARDSFRIKCLEGGYQTPLSDELTSLGTPPLATPAPINELTSLGTPPLSAPAPNNDQARFQTGSHSFFQYVSPLGVLLGMILPPNFSCLQSYNAKILWYFAIVTNIIGFVSFFNGILMGGRLRRLAKRIVTVVEYAGLAFGFIALATMLLPDSINLWVAFGAYVLCFPAIVVAIRG